MAKGKVSFNQERCKGCGLCVEACPVKIIQLDSNVINKKGYNPANCFWNGKMHRMCKLCNYVSRCSYNSRKRLI